MMMEGTGREMLTIIVITIAAACSLRRRTR